MRLGALDVFHLRGHQEMVALGMAGNNCALVLDLDGRLDERWLADRVRWASEGMVELRWRLSRDRLLRPVWRDGGVDGVRPAVIPSGAGDEGAILRGALELLGRPFEGGWRVDVLRGPARDAVVLRWFHPLTDALGAARLLGWLGGSDDALPRSRFASADRLLPESRDERIALARRYFRHVMRLAARPILSPYGSRGKRARPGALRAIRLRLGEEETTSFYRSLRKRAQLADTSIVLWAAARMVDRLLAARGFSPVHQLVPVPLNLDLKGERERMFGNHLTMMMIGLDREALADEAAAVASIARQRREIVRDKLDVGMVAGLALASPLPAPIYSWSSRRPFGGERSSFIVSNPGEIAIERFGDCEVLDAYSMPTALAPPGFQVIVNRHRGRLALNVIFVEGAAGEAEVRALIPDFERDLR